MAPKSEAGKRTVEIPAPLVRFLMAHGGTEDHRPNPAGLVFPSVEGTPLDPRNIRRRHFQPALEALKITGIRPHDFRWTFMAMHVEAGTHPKLVQTRVGHSDIRLTMDTYGKLAGEMALGAEQAARFGGLATLALPDPGKQPANMGAPNGPKPPEPIPREKPSNPLTVRLTREYAATA